MPFADLPDAKIYYEEHGSGFPLLLIAPGGMRSAVPMWGNAPWDPIAHFSEQFRVIAMDQRNAGQSTGSISADDGWHTYAADQLGLLDYLGIDQFHTAGMCIGGPYCLGLAAQAPERVRATVLFQSIGLDDNRQLFFDMFDQWAQALAAGDQSDISESTWNAFRQRLFGGDFLFNLSVAQVEQIQTPSIILCGADPYHPEVTSRTLARHLPEAVFVEHWKEPAAQPDARAAVMEFLLRHTPGR
ncbi:MAG: alpha/beta fold hydrolase [Pseudomonadales bacterium]